LIGGSTRLEPRYQGLWYPIIVVVMSVVIGGLFVRETRHIRIHEEH